MRDEGPAPTERAWPGWVTQLGHRAGVHGKPRRRLDMPCYHPRPFA